MLSIVMLMSHQWPFILVHVALLYYWAVITLGDDHGYN